MPADAKAKIAAAQDDDDDYANDDDQFEESPRQKVGSQGLVRSGENDGQDAEDDSPERRGPLDMAEDEDIDEDEVIDVAE